MADPFVGAVYWSKPHISYFDEDKAGAANLESRELARTFGTEGVKLEKSIMSVCVGESGNWAKADHTYACPT